MSNPIHIEQVYDAPRAQVWKAMTDPSEMKEWYFNLPGFRAEAGYTFQFEGGPEEGPVFIHLCRVTEAIPEKKLAYTWRYEGYPGDTLVTFELSDADENKTRVSLTHEGIQTIAPHHPAFARENFQQGWTDILTKSLASYLNKPR